MTFTGTGTVWVWGRLRGEPRGQAGCCLSRRRRRSGKDGPEPAAEGVQPGLLVSLWVSEEGGEAWGLCERVWPPRGMGRGCPHWPGAPAVVRGAQGPSPPVGRWERGKNCQLYLPRRDPQAGDHLGGKLWDTVNYPDQMMGLSGSFPGTAASISSHFSPINSLCVSCHPHLGHTPSHAAPGPLPPAESQLQMERRTREEVGTCPLPGHTFSKQKEDSLLPGSERSSQPEAPTS